MQCKKCDFQLIHLELIQLFHLDDVKLFMIKSEKNEPTAEQHIVETSTAQEPLRFTEQMAHAH